MVLPQLPSPHLQGTAPAAKISVIIPVYNGAADVPELGTCLLSQTFPADQAEYVLVDNNSQDATLAQLQALAQRAQQQGVRIRLASEASIQSSYAARNRGIQVSSGEILVFTDVDCRPQANWLEALVQPFLQPDVDLVVGEVEALPSRHWLEQYAERAATLSQNHTLAHAFCPYGQTANLAVRRRLLDTVGLFRPYLTTGGDADLCWRLQREANAQIFFAEQAIVYHRHRRSLGELRRQWQRYGKSNKYLHQLHGVPLMRSLPAKEIRYRLLRWILKDFPSAAFRVLQGQTPAIALLEVPLDLYCQAARSRGQQQAQLPPNADWIAWPTRAPSLASDACNVEDAP